MNVDGQDPGAAIDGGPTGAWRCSQMRQLVGPAGEDTEALWPLRRLPDRLPYPGYELALFTRVRRDVGLDGHDHDHAKLGGAFHGLNERVANGVVGEVLVFQVDEVLGFGDGTKVGLQDSLLPILWI